MAGIGCIANPHSQSNLRHPARMKALARVLGQGGRFEPTGTLAELERAAAAFHADRIDILAISGGDGTLHVVLSALVREYGDSAPLPLIALLRGGTMNTIARALGARAEGSRALGQLVGKYRTGAALRVVERTLLQVGDKVGFLLSTSAAASGPGWPVA